MYILYFICQIKSNQIEKFKTKKNEKFSFFYLGECRNRFG